MELKEAFEKAVSMAKQEAVLAGKEHNVRFETWKTSKGNRALLETSAGLIIRSVDAKTENEAVLDLLRSVFTVDPQTLVDDLNKSTS